MSEQNEWVFVEGKPDYKMDAATFVAEWKKAIAADDIKDRQTIREFAKSLKSVMDTWNEKAGNNPWVTTQDDKVEAWLSKVRSKKSTFESRIKRMNKNWKASKFKSTTNKTNEELDDLLKDNMASLGKKS